MPIFPKIAGTFPIPTITPLAQQLVRVKTETLAPTTEKNIQIGMVIAAQIPNQKMIVGRVMTAVIRVRVVVHPSIGIKTTSTPPKCAALVEVETQASSQVSSSE